MNYPKFSRAEWEAIQEALIFRTAGELGDDAEPAEHYESASLKVAARLARYAPRFSLDE